MTLHHYPHQAIDGRWHAVYRMAQCDSLHSVTDAACRQSIERECRRLNAEQARKAAEAEQQLLAPADRRIPAGFYMEA